MIYIDRQLAGPYGRDKYRRYTKAPFVESLPEHGYQGKETPPGDLSDGNRRARQFCRTQARRARSKIAARFRLRTSFRLLRQHTIEGMFSDPMHGGNAGLIGWQLIGYPGPLMSYRNEIDKSYGEAFRRKPVSLAQVTGEATVQGWEEEKD